MTFVGALSLYKQKVGYDYSLLPFIDTQHFWTIRKSESIKQTLKMKNMAKYCTNEAPSSKSFSNLCYLANFGRG